MSLKRGLHGISDEVLRVMEGQYASLRGMPAELRPSAFTNEYIASRLEVPPAQVKSWYARSDELRQRNEKAAIFADLWDKIATLLSEQTEAVVLAVARDPKNRRQLDAAKWALPIINPKMWREREGKQDEQTAFGEYSQDVFDALTEDELQELLQLQREIDERVQRGQTLIRVASARYAQSQVEADATIH